MPVERKKHSSRKVVEPGKKSPERQSLLAASTLTEDQVKQVIRCYAYGRSPAEAQAETGFSHVTIYRLYGYIRQRLLDVGLYRSKAAFIDDMNDWEEEGREHFDWEPFEDALRCWLGARRGIDAGNRDLYTAEAIFRVQDNRFKPLQFYSLILQAVRSTGPLNRPPADTVAARYYQLLLRLHLMLVCEHARAMNVPGLADLLAGQADVMEDRMAPAFDGISAQERRLSRPRKRKVRAVKTGGTRDRS